MYRVAIDGPSGVGKSSLAKNIARQLGIIYVDTGALYRCIGLYCLTNKIDSKNKGDVINALVNIKIDLKYVDGEQRVFLNHKDVSTDIRQPEVDIAASNVASIGQVRDYLKNMQQDIAETNSVIMDGRDIGTVIMPDANVKFFITASAEERATRRYNQQMKRGKVLDYDEILKDIIKRDDNDTNRDVAPLRAADDAIIIDTTENTKEQTLEIITSIIRSRVK